MSETRYSASTGCFWTSTRNAAIAGARTARVSTSQSGEISPRSIARRRKRRFTAARGSMIAAWTASASSGELAIMPKRPPMIRSLRSPSSIERGRIIATRSPRSVPVSGR